MSSNDSETQIHTTSNVAIEDRGRGDLPASTLARMMGVATVTDLKLLDNKMELLASKISGIVAKVDKVVGSLTHLPSTNDMDRIESQLTQLRGMLREALGGEKAAETQSLRSTVVSSTEEKKE